MKIYDRVHSLKKKVNMTADYPLGTMLMALLLIFLSPFVSRYLCYGALLICLCRVIVYSQRVFVVDFVLLIPMYQLFSGIDGMSLLVYLDLFAALWYLIRGRIRADSSVVWFLLLMLYMIARMQLAVANFLLSFGQIFLLFVLLPRQDDASAIRAAKFFCVGLVISSVYALVLRNSSAIIAIIGQESTAIWGTRIMRFRGLIRDPNYYMTMLLVALGLLLKLRNERLLSLGAFWLLAVPTAAFGILTYSKTFLLVAIMLTGIYILWQFGSRKLIWACSLTLLAVAGLTVLILWDGSPLAVVLTRLNSAGSLNELTTGRAGVYADYLEIVFHDIGSFLFGQGIAADGLVHDPHNLYIELLYYTGAFGLVLYVGFYISMIYNLLKNAPAIPKGGILGRYMVLSIVLILYLTLHGMFQPITMGSFLLALLAMRITPRPQIWEPCG